MNKKLIITTLGSFAIGGLVWMSGFGRNYEGWYDHQVSQTKKAQAKNGRMPSSLLDPEKIDFSLYHDYFSYNSFQKYMEYELDVEFRTDKDKEFLQKKARLALHNAITESFKKKANLPEGEGSIALLLKENLIQQFIQNFIKSLSVLKIVNGTFQIDLNFSPSIQPTLNYKNELASNQLVNFDDKDKFSDFLDKKELSLHEKVMKLPTPDTGDFYQYKGGQITIWIKTLDLVWNPANPIPNPKKNAVKGFVRYRRFFKADKLHSLAPFIKEKDFKLNLVSFPNKQGIKNSFVTVDVFKEFNLGQIMPDLERMEVHFGKLLPNNFHKNSLIGRIFNYKEKSLKTGDLFLEGEIKIDGEKEEFKTKVSKLVFDFKKDEFSTKSKLTTTLKGFEDDFQESGRIKYMVKNKLLTDYALQLIKSLNIDDFHKELK